MYDFTARIQEIEQYAREIQTFLFLPYLYQNPSPWSIQILMVMANMSKMAIFNT